MRRPAEDEDDGLNIHCATSQVYVCRTVWSGWIIWCFYMCAHYASSTPKDRRHTHRMWRTGVLKVLCFGNAIRERPNNDEDEFHRTLATHKRYGSMGAIYASLMLKSNIYITHKYSIIHIYINIHILWTLEVQLFPECHFEVLKIYSTPPVVRYSRYVQLLDINWMRSS